MLRISKNGNFIIPRSSITQCLPILSMKMFFHTDSQNSPSYNMWLWLIFHCASLRTGWLCLLYDILLVESKSKISRQLNLLLSRLSEPTSISLSPHATCHMPHAPVTELVQLVSPVCGGLKLETVLSVTEWEDQSVLSVYRHSQSASLANSCTNTFRLVINQIVLDLSQYSWKSQQKLGLDRVACLGEGVRSTQRSSPLFCLWYQKDVPELKRVLLILG